MQYSNLGRTGLQVSRLCLGTMTFGWSSDEATSFNIMDTAIAGGINFFDTANIYSKWVDGNSGGESETLIGKWLQTKSRCEVIIATKVRGQMWQGVTGEGLNRHHIIHAVEDSLKRLQTDYIDLYQTHWFDANTRIEETLSALDHLIQSGKVLYIGASNYPSWRLMKSFWASAVHNLARYETLQPHYSIFHREEYEKSGLLETCIDQKIGVIPYSPLAAGFATGKYTRENRNPDSTRSSGGLIQRLINNEDAYTALDVMQTIASEHQAHISHVALAWQLTKPAITSSIIGARTVEQLEQVMGATELQLSDEEIKQLDTATEMF